MTTSRVKSPAQIIVTKLALMLLSWVMISCGSTRNLAYFSDLNTSDNYETPITNTHELRIGIGDMLGITLNSMNPESNALFNRGSEQNASIAGKPVAGASEFSSLSYLVDENGYIDYPVIGKIKLAGLTKADAAEKIKLEAQKYVKSPLIDIRLLNFKITVIGEVNKPSTFTVQSQQINVLEALGLAGDLTPYGKRENILLIREKDGVRSTTRLNLNQKEVLNSPYFYLQQNDVLYVEPDKQKGIQVSTNTRNLTLLAIASSVFVALLFNIRNF